jgi:hypothetical protein
MLMLDEEGMEGRGKRERGRWYLEAGREMAAMWSLTARKVLGLSFEAMANVRD